jgi:hypothetical protein
MRDTCTVTVPGAASGALDPATWLPTVGAGLTVYSGKCRLRMGGTVAGSQAQDVVGTLVSTSTPTLSVPISAPRLPVGAVVLITDVPDDDPAGHLRLGLRLRVVGQVLGTDMTAQRLTVEAVTG